MTHLDLFSGIGGFAYAADQVWDNVKHTFCDNDEFCRQVLNKHWPESEIYDDIRAITDTTFINGERSQSERDKQRQSQKEVGDRVNVDILTGGFPCQPFSAAGLRRGTSDERHLWPEMLRVIRLTQPEWVIAENVRGLLTWKEGMVFEQVCTDLEDAGYEVQPFIIPAVAVNAPHRRDRIWFVANRRCEYGKSGSINQYGQTKTIRPSQTVEVKRQDRTATNGYSSGLEEARPEQQATGYGRESWNCDWHEVAAELCSVDDGLSVRLDGFELSKSQHRKEQLKAYGNAIVPQIAMEIMKGIKRQGEKE